MSQVFRGRDAIKRSSQAFSKAKQTSIITRTQVLRAQAGDQIAIKKIATLPLSEQSKILGIDKGVLRKMSYSQKIQLIEARVNPTPKAVPLAPVTPEQVSFANTLPPEERQNYLLSIGTRRNHPTQTRLSPEQTRLLKTLPKPQQQSYLNTIESRRVQPSLTDTRIEKLSAPQKDFYKTLSQKDQMNYLSQISKRKTSPQTINLNPDQSNLYKNLSKQDRNTYIKNLAQRMTVKNYDPKKGYFLITSEDPFSGKVVLINSSGNITKNQAQNFVNELNAGQVKRLQTEINELADKLRLSTWQDLKNPIKELKRTGDAFYTLLNEGKKAVDKLLLNNEISKTSKNVLKILKGIIVFGTVGTSIGLVYPFIMESIKALKLILTQNPIKTGKQIVESATKDPIDFWTNFGANIIAFRFIAKSSKAIGTKSTSALTKTLPTLAKTKIFKTLVKNSVKVSKIPKTSTKPIGTLYVSKTAAGIVTKSGKVLNITAKTAGIIEKTIPYIFDLSDGIFDATYFLGIKLGSKVISAIKKIGLPRLSARALTGKAYIRKLALTNPILGELAENTLIASRILERYYKKTRISDINLDIISSDAQVIRSLKTQLKKYSAEIYGSIIDLGVKIRMYQKAYELIENKKISSDKILDKMRAEYKKAGLNKKQIEDVIGKVGDLDVALPLRKLELIANNFINKFREVPDLLKDLVEKKTGIQIDSNDLKLIRKDRNSVLSVLTKKQIDDVLRSFRTEKIATAFKLELLQDLYDSYKKVRSRQGLINYFKDFELSGSGISNAKIDFEVDLHAVNEIASSKKFLGFIRRQYLPIESQKKVNFKEEILKTKFLSESLNRQKLNYLRKLHKNFNNQLRKYGLSINEDKFVKAYPKFLDQSGIRNKKLFSFVSDKKISDINPQVRKSYVEALQFIENVKSGSKSVAKLTSLKNPILERLLIEYLIKTSKKASETLNNLDVSLNYLDEIKRNLVYFSEGGRELFDKKTKLKNTQLKKIFSESESEAIIKGINEFEKQLQNKYSDKNIESMLKTYPSSKLPAILQKETGFIDLKKSFKREQDLIKGIKTDKAYLIKDGLKIRSPVFQLKGRVQGRLSDIFEPRRSKDAYKLASSVKATEFLLGKYIKEIEATKNPLKRFKLERSAGASLKKLKRDRKALALVVDNLTKDIVRKERIFRTRGASEISQLENIKFNDILSKNSKEIVNKKIKSAVKESKGKTNIKDVALIERRLMRLLETKAYTDFKKKYGLIDNNAKKQIAKKIKKVIKKLNLRSVSRTISQVKVRSRIVSKSKSPSKSGSRSKSRSASRSKSRSASRSKSRSASRSKSRSASRSKSRSASRSKSKSISTSKSSSKSISTSKSSSKSKSPSKSSSQSASRSASRSKSTSKLPPPITPRLPKLTWDSKLKKGYSLLVDARYKKGSKVFTRRLRTTPNRARKIMNRFIDNNPQASYDLVVVGAKKVKDIKKPTMQKFTIRRGKNPKVRRNVEKVKYRLDRPREKVISRLRRKKYAIKNKNTPLRKKPSKKRVTRKKRK